MCVGHSTSTPRALAAQRPSPASFHISTSPVLNDFTSPLLRDSLPVLFSLPPSAPPSTSHPRFLETPLRPFAGGPSHDGWSLVCCCSTFYLHLTFWYHPSSPAPTTCSPPRHAICPSIPHQRARHDPLPHPNHPAMRSLLLVLLSLLASEPPPTTSQTRFVSLPRRHVLTAPPTPAGSWSTAVAQCRCFSTVPALQPRPEPPEPRSASRQFPPTPARLPRSPPASMMASKPPRQA